MTAHYTTNNYEILLDENGQFEIRQDQGGEIHHCVMFFPHQVDELIKVLSEIKGVIDATK